MDIKKFRPRFKCLHCCMTAAQSEVFKPLSSRLSVRCCTFGDDGIGIPQVVSSTFIPSSLHQNR